MDGQRVAHGNILIPGAWSHLDWSTDGRLLCPVVIDCLCCADGIRGGEESCNNAELIVDGDDLLHSSCRALTPKPAHKRS